MKAETMKMIIGDTTVDLTVSVRVLDLPMIQVGDGIIVEVGGEKLRLSSAQVKEHAVSRDGPQRYVSGLEQATAIATGYMASHGVLSSKELTKMLRAGGFKNVPALISKIFLQLKGEGVYDVWKEKRRYFAQLSRKK